MNGLLEGKAALVTGAASGIGRATAVAFAREGARVMLADVDEVGGRSAAAAITNEGGDARFAVANVTSEASVETLVAEIVDTFGRIDCAVNNAGMTGAMGPLHRLPLEEFRRVLELNLIGVFLSIKYEIPAMQSAGGAIVNMASGAGLIAAPALSAYCASKHAVLGLTKTAASAISSGVPRRPLGWPARIIFLTWALAAIEAWSIGVSVLPGQIALTRTPVRAFSTAAVRVIPRMPCLVAQ
jgi:NAD(P)-dependent dehydrogenase (short-subunit alcohol dehydrogenase family)